MESDIAPELAIRQIIPGDGWNAVYERSGKLSTSPLVCWALFTDTSGIEIHLEGVIGGERTTLAEGDDFLGYLPPGGELSVYEGLAREREESRVVEESESFS